MTVSLTGKEWAAAMVVKQESEAAEKPKKEMSKWMKKELGIKLKNGKLSEKW